MKTDTGTSKLGITHYEVIMRLEEANEAINILELTFQSEIQILERKMTNAKTQKEKDALSQNAKELYAELETSLHMIEIFAMNLCTKKDNYV